MNNPFDYEPSAQMLNAQQHLCKKIEELSMQDKLFKEEVSKGKMFGILLSKSPEPITLFAFSGQICGKFCLDGFVPPVFDYLDEAGYFKIHENEITNINKKIADLESSVELENARKEYSLLIKESETDINNYKLLMKAAKTERDLIRGKGLVNDIELIKESQFMKAELHRKKLYWKEQTNEKEAKISGFIEEIRLLKLKRQHKSDSLQHWLFSNFIFTNQEGKEKSLLAIYNKEQRFSKSYPPSGSGECCEPKLLNYAFNHGLTPIEIGMFWWGDSPRGEIRHHLHFYPACNGKCKPILEFMLPNTSSSVLEHTEDTLPIVFEDEQIIVVNKPSGMLSVPGTTNKPSVFSILSQKNPSCSLQMVHRLDMDTSGIMVIAKTSSSHKALQKQFADRSTRKVYIAVLEKAINGEGFIELKLRPDFEDRPRQVIDQEYGKEAITHYKAIGGNKIELIPHTGRTHQLRVHCAHKQGLNNPIKGDRLYGKKAKRLYLHAKSLEFNHPTTGERLKFEVLPQEDKDIFL